MAPSPCIAHDAIQCPARNFTRIIQVRNYRPHLPLTGYVIRYGVAKMLSLVPCEKKSLISHMICNSSVPYFLNGYGKVRDTNESGEGGFPIAARAMALFEDIDAES